MFVSQRSRYGLRAVERENEQRDASGEAAEEVPKHRLKSAYDFRAAWCLSYCGRLFLKHRRRIFMLFLAFLVIAFVLVPFFYVQRVKYYSRSISLEPCFVATEALRNLQTVPVRAQVKLELPKIIHHQWKTETIPKGLFTDFQAKFRELFPEPEYTYMLWTDEKARNLIKNDFPFFLQAFDNYKYGIQRADATRYFVLYKYGGLYADLDYEPLINFWTYLPKDRVALVESPYKFNERTQNSLMSSPARDPFWNTSFNILLERKDSTAILESSGPIFLDAVQDRTSEPYAVLPCENFQRIPLKFGGKYRDASPFDVRQGRRVMSKLTIMKYCGDFSDDRCQFGRHHNTAVYNSELDNGPDENAQRRVVLDVLTYMFS